MGLLARGQTVANRLLTQAAGVTIVYTRNGRTCSPTAWPGSTRDEAETIGTGGRFDANSRTYLILASTLQFDGDLVEPADGDVIIETISGIERRYEVRPIAEEMSWSWSGPEQTRYRVRTVPIA